MGDASPYPFPGLNPYFETEWFQVHPTFIVHSLAALQRQMPGDLRASIEQGLSISKRDDGSYKDIQPDVSVWRLRQDTLLATAPPNFSPPVVFEGTSPKARHVAIRDDAGKLVTVIEFLSPTNKHGGGAHAYLQKRLGIMGAGVNLVEVDLVRKWGLALTQFEEDDAAEWLSSVHGGLPAHATLVYRAASPQQRELYPINYDQALPALRVPLRPSDDDVWLNLQEIAETCDQECAFQKTTNYSADPEPPMREQDAKWLDQLLKTKGLR